MLIRKSVIAGLVLTAAGLTVVVSGVIGQQPPADEKTEERAEALDPTGLPTAGSSGAAANPATRAGGLPPPSADEGGTGIGYSSGGFGASSAETGSSSGLMSAPLRGGRSSGKTRRNVPSAAGSAGYDSGGAMGMMSAMEMGMPGMGSSGTSPSVPEDEHLETWVSKALAAYARTEDKNDRTNQQDEIAKALDRIFDIRQQRRMQELETLEQRVQKLRVTLETRKKLKADILKNRIDYLIREADGLGWGDGLPQPGRSAPTGIGSAENPAQNR